jgi:ribosomal protein S12 methylthiotransferase
MEKSIAFVTLGCAKNTVYSEYMMGIVEKSPFILEADPAKANVIVVNTCGFITAAKEETINTILQMAEYKEAGTCDYIVAIGCMVQKYADELSEAMPEIDLLLGSTSYDDIVREVAALYEKDADRIHVDHDWKAFDYARDIDREVTTPGYYAYLTISEGCDNHCTFCAIPEMQGPYRSRPIHDIVKEAQSLAERGVRELIIIAQDTTSYGKDLYGSYVLPELLHGLCKIDGLKWIRLLYAYPNHFTDELIQCMAEEDKICKYVDIPLQHANDGILRIMNRRINQAQIRTLIHKLRMAMPGIVIRSTFIVGFPGETADEYEDLLSFLEEMKLERVGVFPYSQEDNTPAGKMENQISEEIKEERANRLMELQFDNMCARHLQFVGSRRHVFVDDIDDGQGILLCRSYSEAPDVDPFVLVEEDTGSYEVGDEMDVVITGISEYDLIGARINEPA